LILLISQLRPRKSIAIGEKERGRHVMKRISLLGVVLGLMVGALAAMLSGSWILWLGAGIAVGVFLGAAQARRSLDEDAARLRERVNL